MADETGMAKTEPNQVTADQAQDVEGFAMKNNISIDDAKRLIEEHGYDRATLDSAAQALKMQRQG